jgi:hypothetical protein
MNRFHCLHINILRWQTTFLSSQREKGISQIYQNVKLPLRVNLICARVRTNNIYGVEHKYSINTYRVKLYKRVYHNLSLAKFWAKI